MNCKQNTRRLKYGLALMTAASMLACGGGGDDNNAASAPVPTPPTGAADTALTCLPTQRLAAGYREVLDFQVTETMPGQAAATGTRRIDSQVTGTVVLGALTTSRTLEIETFDGSSTERNATYEAIEGSRLINPRLDNLTGAVVTGINTYEPASYVDFGLKAGESHSLTYVSRSTNTASGVSDSVQETETVSFVGREDVTVPLGTFSATCHLNITVMVAGESVVLDGWVAAGSGIPVRLVRRVAVPGGELVRTEVLSAATVNGVALRP